MAIKTTAVNLGLASIVSIIGIVGTESIPTKAQTKSIEIAQSSAFQAQTIQDKLDSTSQQSEDNYFKVHSFEGVAGQQITIEMSASNFNPFVGLLDSQDNDLGHQLAVDGNSLVISTLPVTGTHTIVVMNGIVKPEYSYTINIRPTTAVDVELDKANQLSQQALQLYIEEKYVEAIPIAQQALAIIEATGEDHPSIAKNLTLLALLYQSQAQYAEAEPLLLEALAIRQQLHPNNHPDLFTSLNNLALLYDDQGKYSQAEPLYTEALEMSRRLHGGDHPQTATILNNLAILYGAQGRHSQAEPLYIEALEMSRRLYPEDDDSVATSLNNLGQFYRIQGRYSDAEPLLVQSLEMNQRLYSGDHSDVATSLNNLALLYQSQGRYDEAEALHQQALEMNRRLYQDDHPSVASSLNNLANLYETQGKYSQAEPLYTKALEIHRRLYQGDHPLVATSLNNLALLYLTQEKYSQAEPLLNQALEMIQRLYEGDHPDVAVSLNNLAQLYSNQGQYSQAEPLLNEALAMYGRVYEDNHPLVALSLWNLAFLYWGQKNYDLALEYLSQTTEVEENLLQQNLAGSEAQQQAYLATFTDTLNWVISLHLQHQPENLDAANLAFTTILQRKGRVLDSAANTLPALRQRLNPQQQQILDELADTRSQLSTLVYAGVGSTPPEEYQQQVKTLSTKAENLEAQLARRSSEFKTQTETVTVEAVQQHIPGDAVLVELIQSRPYEPKTNKYGEPRYAAYILTASGQPKWVDLGQASIIDASATKLRKALQDKNANSDYIKEVARELDSLLMQPVRELIGNQTHLLVAPDSQLNLIPFEALVDENNQYLVENYAITYLTSGRDLLRFDNDIESQQPPVIVANPEYSASPQLVANVDDTSSRSVDISALGAWCCSPLPGTEGEAQAIFPLLPDNTSIFTEVRASEAAIKEVNAPSILHIATHGFFLPDVEDELTEPNLGLANNNPPPVVGENPLLRSGLALAGFNPSEGQYEGVLTALEVASINLWGTELVVLSACQTGVGDIRNGEGVYGLRRALVLAGSESQLISLWDVSDEGTKDLMTGYYQKLTQGMGRGEALRQTQLEMLNSQEYQHPYFWAAFIGSGNWQPIDSLEANNSNQN